MFLEDVLFITNKLCMQELSFKSRFQKMYFTSQTNKNYPSNHVCKRCTFHRKQTVHARSILQIMFLEDVLFITNKLCMQEISFKSCFQKMYFKSQTNKNYPSNHISRRCTFYRKQIIHTRTILQIMFLEDVLFIANKLYMQELSFKSCFQKMYFLSQTNYACKKYPSNHISRRCTFYRKQTMHARTILQIMFLEDVLSIANKLYMQEVSFKSCFQKMYFLSQTNYACKKYPSNHVSRGCTFHRKQTMHARTILQIMFLEDVLSIANKLCMQEVSFKSCFQKMYFLSQTNYACKNYPSNHVSRRCTFHPKQTMHARTILQIMFLEDLLFITNKLCMQELSFKSCFYKMYFLSQTNYTCKKYPSNHVSRRCTFYSKQIMHARTILQIMFLEDVLSIANKLYMQELPFKSCFQKMYFSSQTNYACRNYPSNHVSRRCTFHRKRIIHARTILQIMFLEDVLFIKNKLCMQELSFKSCFQKMYFLLQTNYTCKNYPSNHFSRRCTFYRKQTIHARTILQIMFLEDVLFIANKLYMQELSFKSCFQKMYFLSQTNYTCKNYPSNHVSRRCTFYCKQTMHARTILQITFLEDVLFIANKLCMQELSLKSCFQKMYFLSQTNYTCKKYPSNHVSRRCTFYHKQTMHARSILQIMFLGDVLFIANKLCMQELSFKSCFQKMYFLSQTNYACKKYPSNHVSRRCTFYCKQTMHARTILQIMFLEDVLSIPNKLCMQELSFKSCFQKMHFLSQTNYACRNYPSNHVSRRCTFYRKQTMHARTILQIMFLEDVLSIAKKLCMQELSFKNHISRRCTFYRKQTMHSRTILQIMFLEDVLSIANKLYMQEVSFKSCFQKMYFLSQTKYACKKYPSNHISRRCTFYRKQIIHARSILQIMFLEDVLSIANKLCMQEVSFKSCFQRMYFSSQTNYACKKYPSNHVSRRCTFYRKQTMHSRTILQIMFLEDVLSIANKLYMQGVSFKSCFQKMYFLSQTKYACKKYPSNHISRRCTFYRKQTMHARSILQIMFLEDVLFIANKLCMQEVSFKSCFQKMYFLSQTNYAFKNYPSNHVSRRCTFYRKQIIHARSVLQIMFLEDVLSIANKVCMQEVSFKSHFQKMYFLSQTNYTCKKYPSDHVSRRCTFYRKQTMHARSILQIMFLEDVLFIANKLCMQEVSFKSCFQKMYFLSQTNYTCKKYPSNHVSRRCTFYRKQSMHARSILQIMFLEDVLSIANKLYMQEVSFKSCFQRMYFSSQPNYACKKYPSNHVSRRCTFYRKQIIHARSILQIMFLEDVLFIANKLCMQEVSFKSCFWKMYFSSQTNYACKKYPSNHVSRRCTFYRKQIIHARTILQITLLEDVLFIANKLSLVLQSNSKDFRATT